MLKIVSVTVTARKVFVIKRILAFVLPVTRVSLISMEGVFPVAVNQ